MLRILFEKTGDAIYISHLDLMRLFCRAFQRAGLPLTHSQGFNPRPSVSIALPLSLGVRSCCELLDFDLTQRDVSCDEIRARLNAALIDGVRVLHVYEGGRKTGELAWADYAVCMEYDRPIPPDAATQIDALFRRPQLEVEKKGKNGISQQDILPMIRRLAVCEGEGELTLQARLACQNPALNPAQLAAAVTRYLPELRPDFFSCARLEVYDQNETVFR